MSENQMISRAVCSALLTVAAGLLAWQPAADACTRVLWNNNKLPFVITGRSMDWPETTEPVLTVLPRGMKRDGGRAGSEVVVGSNPALWTSKYGSLVTTIYGMGTADGFNERGLGAHMLYLKDADFGPRVVSKPAVQAGLWAQFLLDNVATVEEALALLNTVQVVTVESHGHKANVHLAIEDASGDSAIIEYANGGQIVHHGREYRIMTNEPLYAVQLALLKEHDFSKPSSATPLPGNVRPEDRFQRAAYFAALLPAKPNSEREAVAAVLAIVRNASVPFGAPYQLPDIISHDRSPLGCERLSPTSFATRAPTVTRRVSRGAEVVGGCRRAGPTVAAVADSCVQVFFLLCFAWHIPCSCPT